MFLNLFIYLSLVSLVTGEKGDMTVHQNPHDLIINDGKSAEIKCFHKIPNYDRLLWYKQSERGTNLLQHYIPLDVLTCIYSSFFTSLIKQKMFGLLILLSILPLDLGLKQSPHLFVTEDLNVTIKCSQSGTSYNSMYWFRKTPTEPLEQIVYFYIKNENWEKNFKERASAVRNGASLDLTLASPFPASGESLSDRVHQNPPHLITNAEKTVQLSCSHTIKDYRMILWYQQLRGDNALNLIGYVYYKEPTIESQSKNQFSIKGDGAESSTLNVTSEKEHVGSTAIYYCAASKAQCC
ncbi:hypothetical protein QQF64_011302 [Cirrhinus molitorella]|uniref:Ig-like domain-containing protein n=1 Tax=Cirrhinus molitorella TaxID=172907 RepID=A0ABR3LYV6_9TELE